MEEKENFDSRDNNDIFSKAVRAGKRTYFFDVRATRNEDFYLTITESKRVFNEDGSSGYKKHKIFLYKEDFEKFSEGLKESFVKIIDLHKEKGEELESTIENKFTDISFDDLDNHTQKEE